MQIINIGSLVLNNYIIKTNNGCIVIDTGYSGGFERFRTRYEARGLKPEDIRFVFLTHAHDDHVGYLNELLDYTQAPVILHKAAVERLKKGQNSFDGGCPTRLAYVFCRLMSLAGKGKHLFPSVDREDRYLVFDGERQFLREAGFSADILNLQGHTENSIGLLFDDGSLFCGDSAMNGIPSQARHSIWIENVQDFRNSWDVILGKPVKIIYPGHGKPFPPEDLKRFKDFTKGRKIYKL